MAEATNGGTCTLYNKSFTSTRGGRLRWRSVGDICGSKRGSSKQTLRRTDFIGRFACRFTLSSSLARSFAGQGDACGAALISRQPIFFIHGLFRELDRRQEVIKVKPRCRMPDSRISPREKVVGSELPCFHTTIHTRTSTAGRPDGRSRTGYTTIDMNKRPRYTVGGCRMSKLLVAQHS